MARPAPPPAGDGAAPAGGFRLAAKVDLDAIRHNVAYLEGLTPPGCRLMAVVKADAYGHGDVEVARAALQAGAECLGVALVEEGERLRAAGFDCPVHLLFEPPAGQEARAVAAGLTCTVYTERFASALSEAALGEGRRVPVHLKIDTGMRRVGVEPEAVPGFLRRLSGLRGVRASGIYTHFPVASDLSDPFTEGQMDVFERLTARAREQVGADLVAHAANSAAVLAYPRCHYDMVRVGIAMLGLPPSPDVDGGGNLVPALSLSGRVALVKRVRRGQGVSYGLEYRPPVDTFLATLPIGYADGLSRALTGKADVIIAGRRRPIVGAVCMDMCMAELGDDEVEPGTPFTVIGREGNEEITADELASKLGTINYEVTCMISGRVPRVYTGKHGRETADDETLP